MMAGILGLIIISLLLKCSTGSVEPSPATCFSMNVAYDLGHSIASKKTAGPDSCQVWCQMVRLCSHFAYNYATGTCFLRQGDREVRRVGYVSGPKFCPTYDSKNASEPICKTGVCIMGGKNINEGNVIVDNKPVCDDNWGLEDAAVLCRQLGFPGVERATSESEFGTVSSDYSMDNVRCKGDEKSIRDCYHKTQDACYGNEGAGVVCATEPVGLLPHCFEDDQLCLAGGTSPESGNVYLGGHPVCHNGWDFPDANVVCRSLGFIGAKDSEVGGCNSGTVAGVYCTSLVGHQVHRVTHEGAIIGLSITTAFLSFLLITIIIYINREKRHLKLKTPSLPIIMTKQKSGTVEDLVAADYNEIYQIST